MKNLIYFLLVGSLVMLLPFGSSMNLSNAMAIADYDNTDQYMNYAEDMIYKEYTKSHSDLIQKIKCNNINANLNNIDANIGSPIPSDNTEGGDNGEALAAQGEIGWANDDRKYADRENNFSVVCINNNDNENNIIVINETTPEPDLACEECFAANSTIQTTIENILAQNDEVDITFRSFDSILAIAPGTDTIEQLCKQIELSAELFGVPVTDLLLKLVLSAFLQVDFESPNSGIDALIECLLEAGIIFHEERQIPLDSISATALDSMNIECTGSPLCAKLEQQ